MGRGKQRMVRVSAIDGDPLPFGREGDVEYDDEEIVDFYMASLISLDPTANFGVEAEEEGENF